MDLTDATFKIPNSAPHLFLHRLTPLETYFYLQIDPTEEADALVPHMRRTDELLKMEAKKEAFRAEVLGPDWRNKPDKELLAFRLDREVAQEMYARSDLLSARGIDGEEVQAVVDEIKAHWVVGGAWDEYVRKQSPETHKMIQECLRLTGMEGQIAHDQHDFAYNIEVQLAAVRRHFNMTSGGFSGELAEILQACQYGMALEIPDRGGSTVLTRALWRSKTPERAR